MVSVNMKSGNLKMIFLIISLNKFLILEDEKPASKYSLFVHDYLLDIFTIFGSTKLNIYNNPFMQNRCVLHTLSPTFISFYLCFYNHPSKVTISLFLFSNRLLMLSILFHIVYISVSLFILVCFFLL